ncbi:MAG: hypothetical protein AAGU32_14090 [Bacillota bacterium]
MPFSNGYDPTDERMEAATLDQECPFDRTPTNADRIRGTSDEGLAAWVTGFFDHALREADSDCGLCDNFASRLLDWLRKPAEEP